MDVLQENWNKLIFPNSINVDLVNDSEYHAIITVEPLERGYGTTLGNALRRVLLSSIKGFAVTAVKIDTVLHEYSVISGIREDVADIIMNIKQLIITKPTTSPTTISLKLNKKGVVYAKDIELTAGVKILNPDLVICNIEDPKVNLNVEMDVEYGMGYALTEEKEKNNKKDVSTIYLDTLFNPVKRVSYQVENSRIGQQTNYDKLVLEIETNGTVTAREAVGIAAKIIQRQLETFITFEVPKQDFNTNSKSFGDDDIFNKQIFELELSVRTNNCLKAENVIFVGDLVKKTEADMLKFPNFGKKSLTELKKALDMMGLSFGMKIDDWKRPVVIDSSTTSKKKNKE